MRGKHEKRPSSDREALREKIRIVAVQLLLGVIAGLIANAITWCFKGT